MASEREDVKKHVLIVYAHQRPGSMNDALYRAAVETFTTSGHVVEVSELYQIKFNPVADLGDFEGGASAEVEQEVGKVMRADLIVFQFPIYWSSVPAILKGWMDRVLERVSAFVLGGDRFFENGYMKGKKAVLSFTSGTKEPTSSELEVMLLPIQNGILNLIGMEVLSPQVTASPEYKSHEQRQQDILDWKNRIAAIFDEPTRENQSIQQWAAKNMIIHR